MSFYSNAPIMPLFERSENGEIRSAHHPFTLPENLDHKDPLEIRSYAFDLVLNGVEIASGSMRIHDANLQRHIFTKYLNINSSKFDHLLRALDYGAPPHGGIAFGLDRLMQLLVGEESMRSAIAFSKSSGGNEHFC
ncbi:hypothetical protein ACOME3_000773 [Neoechinorhynchus agilis]